MPTNKGCTLLLALYAFLASSIAVVTAKLNDPMNVRDLQVAGNRPWFERIATTYVAVNIERCHKKSTPPANGSKCGANIKTCFFGNQACDAVGSHPTTKCVCSLGKWTCNAEICPSAPSPPNGCSVKGIADLSSNDPLCPVGKGPLEGNQGGCVPNLYGKTCKFGSEECCGKCYPKYSSKCDSTGKWMSTYTNKCLSLCEDPTGATTPPKLPPIPIAPIAIASCPNDAPMTSNTTTCNAANQETPCVYKTSSDEIPGGICTTTDTCICEKTTNLWQCDTEIGCVSENPPSIVACPVESPLVTNATKCDAASQEQPCVIESTSSTPDAVCTSTDTCSCDGATGLWACNTFVGCVSANPPVIESSTTAPPSTASCPNHAQMFSGDTTYCNAANQETPCVYRTTSGIPGSLCFTTDTCICALVEKTIGLWQCDSQMTCD